MNGMLPDSLAGKRAAIFVFALTFPLFVWQAGAQVAALTMETMEEPAYTVYTEDRVWQIANDGDGTTDTRTWDNGGGDNLWSTAANWSSDTVPDSDDIAYFGSTSTADAIVDMPFAGMIKDLKVAPGYTGVISIARNLTLSGGSVIQSGGTLSFGSYGRSLKVGSGFITYPKAILTAGTGTIILAGTGTTHPLTSTGTFNNLTINNGLVGYWPMDEGTGSIIARDRSGNGFDGTLTNGPTWSDNRASSMKFNNPKSLYFDGTNDWVSVSTVDALNPRSITVSAWVYPVLASGGNQGIVSKSTSATNGWLLYRSGTIGSEMLVMGFYTSSFRTANTTVGGFTTLNQWYHVAGTYDANVGQGYSYLNGSRGTVNSTAGSIAASATNMAIGNLYTSGQRFRGNIDDVRVYNRALSLSEVQRLAAGYQDTGSGVYQLGSSLDVNGNLSIVSGGISPSSNNVTVAGNWTNYGTFAKGTSTVSLDGSTHQTMSGWTVFNNLSATTSVARTLFLDYAGRQSASGSLTLRGIAGNLLSIRSTRSASGARIDLDAQSTQGFSAINYLDVKDANAGSGQALGCGTTEGCVDSGNNTNWNFASTAPSITGTVYVDTGATIPLTGVSVSLSINGAAAFATDAVDAGGQFTIPATVTVTGGSILTLYIEDSTHDAVTVSTGSGGAMTGITLIKNNLIVRSGTGTHTSIGSPLTSATLNVADNSADADITAIYTMSSLNTTVVTGKTMYVWTGSTFNLGGTLTVGSSITNARLHINGNFKQNNNAITLNAKYTQSGGTFTGSSGGSAFTTNESFAMDGGTFIATTGTWTHKRGIAIADASMLHNSGSIIFQNWNGSCGGTLAITGSLVFNHATFTGCAGASNNTWKIATSITVAGMLILEDGAINQGTIVAQGNIVQGAAVDGGSALIQIAGTGDQRFTGNTGAFPISIEINKSSGTLTFAGSIAILKLRYTAGAYDAGTGSVIFSGYNGSCQNNLNITGSLVLNNVLFTGCNNSSWRWDLSNNLITARGTLTLHDSALYNGKLIARSNYILSSGFDGGTVALTFAGTGAQIIENEGGTWPSGTFTVAKPSGTATLSGALTLNTSGQDLFLTGSTLDLNGFNLTVNDRFDIGTGTTLRLNGDETISGGPDRVQRGATIWYDDAGGSTQLLNVPYYHLILGSTGSTTFRYPHAQQLNLTGSLTISGGTLTVTNGQRLNVSGSLIQYKGGAFSAGTGTVNLRGLGANLTLSGSSAFNHLNVNNGLVGYWKLDEGTGSTVAKDSSGNGNNGTLTNGPTWSNNTASSFKFQNNRSLHFDGSDDYIEVSHANILNPRVLSISAWIKTTQTALTVPINKYSGSFTGYSWRINGTANKIGFYVGAGSWLDSSASVNNGTWRHVATTNNGTTSTIYINGAFDSSAARTPNIIDTVPLRLGRSVGDPQSLSYNGLIDDVRIYNRALSASEVARLAAGYQDTGSGTYTLGSSLDVNGNLSVIAGGINAGSKSLTLAGNLANYGTFTKGTSTVTLDGSGNQTVSGSTIFNALSVTTSTARTIFFDYSGRQSASGSLTLRGVSGNTLSLRSTRNGSGARVDLDADASQLSTDFTYADVQDINSGSGQTLTCYTTAEGCTDSGNNTNWTFADPGYTITGTVYSNTGATTPLASVTVALSLNGAAASYTDTTDAGGQFTLGEIPTASLTGGTILTLYIDDSTHDAVTVSTGSGGSMTGITLIKNNLIVRSGTGTNASIGSPITSTTLNVANNNADADISAIYTMSSLNTTVVTGKTMYVWTGSTFNLGGTLTVGSSVTNARLHINGNFVQNNNVITVNAQYTQSGGTFTGSSGGSAITLNRAFSLSAGTFRATSGVTSILGVANGAIFTQSGGTFVHNSGLLEVIAGNGGCGAQYGSINVPSSLTLFDFRVTISSAYCGADGINISAEDTITVENNFIDNLGDGKSVNAGTIEVLGDVVMPSTSSTAGGTAVVVMASSDDQTIASSGGTLPIIRIDKPSGTVSAAAGYSSLAFSHFDLVSGTFISPSGTLSIVNYDSADNSVFRQSGGVFNHNNATVRITTDVAAATDTLYINVPDSIDFYNLTIDQDANSLGADYIGPASGDSVHIRNTLTLSSQNNNGIMGTYHAYGNVIIDSANTGGPGSIIFVGTGSQIIENEGGTRPTGTWTIAKPSGIATLSGALTLNTSGQDLFLTGSTLDLNGFNLTVNDRFDIGTGTTLRLNGDETISGGPDRVQRGATIWYDDPGGSTALLNVPYYHLILGSTGSTTFRYPHAQQLNLTGSLTISGGTLTVTNGQRLNVSGSLIQYKGGAFSAGTGTVNLRSVAPATLSGTSAFNHLNVNNGLVGYWKLDEGTGSTVAKDSSGNGNNGTLTNGPTWSNSTASSFKFQNNRSLHFDGSNDYVNNAGLTGLPTNLFTVSIWMNTTRPSNVTTSNVGFALGDGTGGRTFWTGVWDSNDKYMVSMGSPTTDLSLNIDTNTGWHHVAAIKTANGLAGYIDGTYIGIDTDATASLLSTAMTIGNYASGSFYHLGFIDDVRIYNRALSASEIRQLAAGYQDTGSGTYTLGSSLDVNGNLSVIAGGINAGSTSLTLAGNLANYGTFTKGTSTVTLDGSGHQTVSGSTIFNALSATTSTARTIFFDYSGRQSASGSLTLRGVSGNTLSLRSTRNGSGARVDLDADASQLSTDFTYADVKDINSGSGQTILCYTTAEGCTDSGNNINWTFTDPGYTITGTVYSNTGATTPLTGVTVALSLNGAAASYSDAVDNGGQFTLGEIPTASLTGGTIITLYIDDSTHDAVTVSTGSGGSMTGITLIKNNLIVRSGTGTHTSIGSPITSTTLNVANNNGDADISALYTMSSLNTTVVTGKTMYVWTGSTFNLGGTLTVGSSITNARLHINGNFKQNNNAITLNAQYTQSGGTFTGSSGGSAITMNSSYNQEAGTFVSTNGILSVARADSDATIFTYGGGTFTHNSGTLKFDYSGSLNGFRTNTISLANILTVNDLTIDSSYNDVQGNWSMTYSLSGGSATIVTLGTFIYQSSTTSRAVTLNNGTIEARGDIATASNAAGGTTQITLNGSGTQRYQTNGGTFPYLEVNKSTGIVVPQSGTTALSVTRFTLTAGNFTAPTGIMTVTGENASSTIFTYTAGTFTHSGGALKFDYNNSLSGTRTHTVSLASPLTVGALTFDSSFTSSQGVWSLAYSLGGTSATFVPTGTFTYRSSGTRSISLSSGTIRPQGDVKIGNGANGGTTIFTLSGTGSQVLESEGGTWPSGTFTIAKPSGTATLSGSLTLNTSGQDLFMTGGTLDLNGFNLTVNDRFDVGTGTTLRLNGDETISGGPDRVQQGATIWYDDAGGSTQLLNVPYYHLILGSTGSTTFRYPHRSQLNLTGSLTISGGTLTVTNGQRLNVSGSLIQYKGGAFSAGTGTVNLRTVGPATLSGTSAFNNLNINNGLVGYWKLDEGTGSLVAKDSSGNGNNGTLTNGPTWSNSTASSFKFQNNRSLHFDGSDDYVTVPDSSSLDLVTTGTISYWFRRPTLGTHINLGKWQSTGNQASYLLQIYTDNTIYFVLSALGTDRTNYFASSSTFTNTGWNHLVGVYDGAGATNAQRAKVYLNGSPLSGSFNNTIPTSLFNSTATVENRYDSSNYNKGLLDDIRIYNRALSAGEVSRLAAGYQDTGSGTYTLGSSLDVNGNLSVIAGGINAGSKSINLAGDLANYGTFTRGTSTVTLDGSGNQTVSGSTIFNALSATTSTARTIFFDYSGRQSASGSLTLRGVSGNTLSLRSTRNGSGARVDLDADASQLSTDFTYADVKDINSGSGQTLICATSSEGCVNSGNNINWTFSGPTFTDIRPQDEAPFADVRLPLRITFNQNVSKGSGNISIYKYNGTLFQSIPVGNAAVSFMNSNTLLIEHNVLETGTGYYVNIDSGAFVSSVTGLDFEGISNATTWNFITTMNVEGTVYNEAGTAPVGAGVHVVWRKNGGAVVDDTMTDASGNYSLTGATMLAGDVIAIYLDNGNEAVTMVRAPGRDISGVDLYVNNVIIRSDQSGQPITTTNINTGYVGSEPQITNVFQMSGNNTIVQSGKRLMTVSDFNAGGNVVTPNATIRRGFTLGQHTFASSGVVLRGSGASFNAGTGSLQIKGPFTLSGGTFVQNQAPMRVTGNFVLNRGTTFTKATNGAALTLAGDLELNASGANLGNLYIGESPDVITLSGDLLVDSLTIRANDTLVTNGYDITVLGTFTNSGTLTASAGTSIAVGGNLVNYGTYTAASSTLTLSGSFLNNGTFNAGTSTVTLDGVAQTLSGTTLFYNLQKTVASADTLWFGTGSITTVSGSLTLRGASSNLLSVRSTKAGVQRTLRLDVDGTQTIDYLSVRDSNASDGQELLCYAGSEGCINAGNNNNWVFSITGTGTVKGLVWNDADGDGVKDAGETTGLNAITASLTGTTGTGMSINRNTSTNANGLFFFSGSIVSNSAGYTVTVNSNAAPTGYIRTRFNSSGSNILGTGSVIDIRFGYVLPSTISGSVFLDTDEDGERDAGENTVFTGATLTLTGTTSTGASITRQTTTNTSGAYIFSNLAPSPDGYLVIVSPPDGYETTSTNSRTVSITTGGSARTEAFGFIEEEEEEETGGHVGRDDTPAPSDEDDDEAPIVIQPQPVTPTEPVPTEEEPVQPEPETPVTPVDETDTEDAEYVRDLLENIEERRNERRENAAETDVERVRVIQERVRTWIIGGQETILLQVSPIVRAIVAVPSAVRAGLAAGGEQIAAITNALNTLSDAAARQIAAAGGRVGQAMEVVDAFSDTTARAIAAAGGRVGQAMNAVDAFSDGAARVIAAGLHRVSDTAKATRDIVVVVATDMRDSVMHTADRSFDIALALVNRSANTARRAGDGTVIALTTMLRSAGDTGAAAADTVHIAWDRTVDGIGYIFGGTRDLSILTALRIGDAADQIRTGDALLNQSRDALIDIARTTAEDGIDYAAEGVQSAGMIAGEVAGDIGEVAGQTVAVALTTTTDIAESMLETVGQTAVVALDTTTDIAESMQETVGQLGIAVTDTASDLADATVVVADAALSVADGAVFIAVRTNDAFNEFFMTAGENLTIAFEQLSRGVTPTQIAELPPARQYETEIVKRDNQILIAQLHLSVFNSLGLPVRNTPVVLFSTPKISTTNDEGVATFRDVEAGKHRLEVHVSGESVESREIIIEAPAEIQLADLERVQAVLPVIQVMVEDTTMHAAAPYQLTWLWTLVGLLSVGNAAWFAAWVWRRKTRLV